MGVPPRELACERRRDGIASTPGWVSEDVFESILLLQSILPSQVRQAELGDHKVHVGARNGDVVYAIDEQRQACGTLAAHRDDATPTRTSVSSAREIWRAAEPRHKSAADSFRVDISQAIYL
jgi:hypothetical protein